MKGRPPKSTVDLKTNGTYRADRHANRLTVPTVGEIPPPPDHFDAEHAAAWVEFCETLKANDLLTAADHYAARTFVEATVTARRTYMVLVKAGFILDDRKHPLHLVYSEAVKTMRALYDQFGLTPRARMAMKMPDKSKPQTSIFDLMKGRVKKPI